MRSFAAAKDCARLINATVMLSFLLQSRCHCSRAASTLSACGHIAGTVGADADPHTFRNKD